jgi:FKBP-type peptidyl-prolyl cis-trans isomerase (trigger factor)
MQKTIKKLPKSEVAIEVTIPEDVFESYRDKAITRMGEHVEVAGFRKGKAPKELIEKEIRPMSVLEEMAEMAISEYLPKIFAEDKIDAIGNPSISITKIAQGNPLSFTATVAVVPEVKLPDYKKIAAKTFASNKVELVVTDEELDKAISELKKARKHQEIHASGETHDHEAFEKEVFDSVLTDEYVKLLGPFETVEDFKNKFRENILLEKQAREREKGRVAVLEEILKETEVEIPQILVDNELDQLIARIKADIANAGIGFEDYLKHIQKTEDDMRKELLPDAEKRAKGEMVLHAIGTRENLSPKPEAIENETKRLMDMYKDADENRARAYIAHMLTNEEIFTFLELQK